MNLRCLGRAMPVAGLAVVLVLPGSGARGQNITVNGRPLLAQTLNREYMIVPGLGQQVGSNLFHSFGAFNLSQGETATFSGPASVANVIGRVTGGMPSSIDGTIHSTIPGANIYLINPAGVVFGPNAAVKVLGSFHASSADYLRLEDNARFQATNPNASKLTFAAPEAFGFLISNPRSVIVNNATLSLPNGPVPATLGLVGGPVTINGKALLAPGGTVRIASLAGPGEVPVNPRSGSAPTAAGFGPVRMEKTRISVSDPKGGSIAGNVRIHAGSLEILNSEIDADNKGPGPGGVVSLRGDNAVTLTDHTRVHSVAMASGSGADINIGTASGGTVMLDKGAEIQVFSLKSGAGGAVSIAAPDGTLVVRNGAKVDTTLAPGATAQSLGNVTVQADSITLQDTGLISSLIAGPVLGGSINITAGKALFISDAGTDPKTLTGVSAQGGKLATKPGDITVWAGNLTIEGRGVIDTDTFGGGNAGNVTVVVSGALLIAGRGGLSPPARIASIPSETNLVAGATNTGQVVVQAGRLTIRDGGHIGADTAGTSTGGLVKVSADSINLQDGGTISSTTAASGAGGPVEVTARDLFVSKAGNDLTGISAQSEIRATGQAGTVTVRAVNLTIVGQGQIDATTSGAGHAGNVIIQAGTLTLRNGGQLSSATAGSGHGGDVTVRAGSNILLTGPGSQITATSSGNGNAGSITVLAPQVSLRNGASISTQALSANGGNITISLRDLLYLQRGSITTSVNGALGNGGNISIDPRFVILDRSVIAANAVGGNGGNLLIRADQFVPSADSNITATSVRSLPGTITISSPSPNLTGNLVVLAGALRAAAAVLTESCAAHGADPRSSLVMAGRGALRYDPETTLPALYFANRGADAWQKHGPKPPPVRPLHTSVSLTARCR